MARVELSVAIEHIRGAVGNVVFKRHGEGTVLTRRARHKNTAWSEKTVAHRGRFKAATDYGKDVCADPAMKAEYLDIRRRQRKETTPINAFAIGDYFNPPTVEAIHAEKYAGNPGDDIWIHACDDVGVVSIEVVLMDESGTVLEQGRAEERGSWHYTAKTHVPEGTTVRIEATATDRPGGTGTLEVEIVVGGRASSSAESLEPRPGRRAASDRDDGAMIRRRARTMPDGVVREPGRDPLLE